MSFRFIYIIAFHSGNYIIFVDIQTLQIRAVSHSYQRKTNIIHK